MKKKMKNLMSVILAVLLVAGVMPAAAVTAFADEYDEAETIAADTFRTFEDVSYDPVILKFVPAVSDVYRFYTENAGGSLQLDILNDARVTIATANSNYNTNECEIKDLFLYADNIYYIRITSYRYGHYFGFYTETQHEYEYDDEDITLAPTCLADGKANGVCKHCNSEGVAVVPMIPHADTDSDGFCNACGKRLSYTISEGEQLTFPLISKDSISVYFTCPKTADYIITDNGNYYSRTVFDSEGVELNYIDSRYPFTENETYCIVYKAYDWESTSEISCTIRHNHVDSGNGTCTICSQSIYNALTAETVYEFDSLAKEYTYLTFTPEESGLYRFSLSSEYGWTYVSNNCDENGESIPYEGTCMALESGKKYIFTVYNYSASDETAYALFSHKHVGSEETPDVCKKCGKTFLVPIAEGVEQTLTLEPFGARELVFTCEKAGRYMLISETGNQGVTVESPRDESGAYENYVDGYYDFAVGTSHYYNVYSNNNSETSISFVLAHKHKISGNDGACDICGKTVCHTVSEGEIFETTIPASDEVFVRFTPSESGKYNFFMENSNANFRGLYKATGEFVSYYSSSSYTLEKDVTYDLAFYTYYSSSGRVKVLINHDHYSQDGDNFCDRCNIEYMFTLTEGQSTSFTIPAGNIFYLKFTPQYSAYYNMNYSGGLSCEGFYDSYGNYIYTGSKLTAGREYTIKMSANRFKQVDGSIIASHIHADEDGNGNCDYCGEQCTVTVTEDVPVTINLAPGESVIAIIECQRTGKYKLVNNGPTAISYLYDEYGATYSADNCDLEKDKTYTATIRNTSNSAISQTITLTHIHVDKNNDTKCDVCDTVYRYELVTDVKQTVTIGENETVELIYVPEKTNNYIFITNGSCSYSVYDTNNYCLSSYGSDPVREISYYHLTGNKTYIIKVQGNGGSGENSSVDVLATHAHLGTSETVVEPGIATNGIDLLTCSECGEQFYVKKYRTGNEFDEGEYEGFKYRIYEKNGEKEISITAYIGDDENAVIPSEIDGIPVTQISSFSYDAVSDAKSVVIPDSVREIGGSAFVAAAFASVTIPDSVVLIGDDAFVLNFGLETVNIGSGVKYIGKQAFTTCLDDEFKAELTEELEMIKTEFGYMFAEISEALGAEITSFEELKEYAQTHELPEEYKDNIEEILYYADVYTAMFDLYDRAIATEESSLKKIVYNGTEAEWNDVIIDEDDGTIAGAAFSCLHTATLMVDGEVYDTITFAEDEETLDLPDVPEKRGSTGAWSEYTLAASDIEITAIYTPITYYATVIADGNVIDTIPFVYGQKSIALPDVPKKEGYTGSWPTYSLGDEDITIEAVYKVNSYTATFIKDGEVLSTADVEFGQAIAMPRIPEKKGYEFKGWNPEIPETMPAKPLEFTAVYEPVTYYATFMADGEQVGEKVPFTVESTSIEEPAVPAKEGYTGTWESYELVPGDITANAVYTVNSYKATYLVDGESYMNCLIEYGGTMLRPDKDPVKDGYAFVDWDADIPETMPAKDLEFNALFVLLEYKATFVADGVTVGEVLYTVESTSIEEPAVPAKEGYTGKWESYEFVPGGITVNAVYTEVEAPEPENPTAGAKLNVKSSQTVEYKANVTVTATAENVPDGYVLAIYEGGTLRETGSNTTVSYKAGTMTSNRTFTVKVIDMSKNVQKDANGNELSANCEVKVKSGFFDKIIAFFKGLFRALPNIEVKP